MKGKAQKQSKESFIRFIVGQSEEISSRGHSLFLSALKICLLENPEPFEEEDQQIILNMITSTSQQLFTEDAKERRSQGIFDSKQFAKRHDCFQDKLQFAQEILSYAEERNFPVLYSLIANGQLHSVLERLVCSGNSKVRLQAMKVFQGILDLFVICRNKEISSQGINNKKTIGTERTRAENVVFIDPAKQETKENEFNTIRAIFCQFSLPVLKLALEQPNDSKIQLYCLTLLDKTFQIFVPAPGIKSELERYEMEKKHNESKRFDTSEIEGISFDNEIKVRF